MLQVSAGNLNLLLPHRDVEKTMDTIAIESLVSIYDGPRRQGLLWLLSSVSYRVYYAIHKMIQLPLKKKKRNLLGLFFKFLLL